MPETITLADGSTKEVPTEEEIEQQKAEAAEKAREEATAEFESEKQNTQTELEKLQSELESEKEKAKNFANLRYKAGKTEEELKAESEKRIEDLNTKIEEKDQKLRTYVVERDKNDLISQISDNDPEVMKAVKANYNRIKDPEDTIEQIKQKVNDAYAMTLSQAGLVPTDDDALARMDGTGAGGGSVSSGPKLKISEEAKDPVLLSRFGLEQKDLDKHLKT